MRIIENASYEHRKMLRSLSLPHVDLKRLKLIKQDSNLSDDSSSGFKDSGIDGGDDNLDIYNFDPVVAVQRLQAHVDKTQSGNEANQGMCTILVARQCRNIL